VFVFLFIVTDYFFNIIIKYIVNQKIRLNMAERLTRVPRVREIESSNL